MVYSIRVKIRQKEMDLQVKVHHISMKIRLKSMV